MIIQYIYISAVKRLIAINRIQNKSCLHNICMCAVYIYYVYIHTHACIYLRKIGYVYILNIFIYNINYMNINIDMQIHANIFKIFTIQVHLNKLECREKVHLFQ